MLEAEGSNPNGGTAFAAEPSPSAESASFVSFVGRQSAHSVGFRCSASLISRRDLLGYAGTGALLSRVGWPAMTAAAEADVSFLVVGDWGKPERVEDARAVADQMGKTGDIMRPRFVISTGDNFYPSGVTGTDDPKWRSVFEEVYRAPSLMCPWYPVLGNHDHDGDEEAQILYSAMSTRWRMEARYYTRTERLPGNATADFFFLDTEPVDDMDVVARWLWPDAAVREQIGWLERKLETSRADWKIVVGHHPVLSGGHHGSTPALVDTIKPLLERHGVQAYINGHDHDLQHIVDGGVHYLTSGSGSEVRETGPIAGTLFARATLGFMSATVGSDDMDIAFFDPAGTTLHSARIPKER